MTFREREELHVQLLINVTLTTRFLSK